MTAASRTSFATTDLVCRPDHEPVLMAALRAPSAHNAQAWRLVPLEDGESYEVHYDHHDYLPHDPDDRDACLAMGAFVETLVLAADRDGLQAQVRPVLERRDGDLDVARVRLRPAPAGHIADPLAAAVGDRCTNRLPYRSTPLAPGLVDSLTELGCRLQPPAEMAALVRKASLLSWGDRRFVADLARWMRWTNDVTDGLTPACLGLTAADQLLLRLALRLGRLPRWAAAPYAARDVRLLRSAPAVAVLTAPDTSLPALFDAGRRLLRCWVTICAAGAAYHPISIAVDVPETGAQLDARLGQTAVAMFRIGYPDGELPPSARRPLSSVLRPPVVGGGA
jgi:nitroreductase